MITGEKLTHLGHCEDYILRGENYIDFVLDILYNILEFLKGNDTDKRVTVKIDGCPSVLCASNFNGKNFIAYKGGFASKEMKIADSEDKVRELFSKNPDVLNKMLLLFKYSEMIGIPKNEIWQGDFLYSKKDLKTQIVDGIEYITFQPNTLIYAIESSDVEAKKVLNSEIGVAWHTKYIGDDLNNLKMSFDVNVENANQCPTVYQIDGNLPNIESIKLSDNEYNKLKDKLDMISKYCTLIESDGAYKQFDDKLIGYIDTLRNAFIKNQGVQNITVENLIDYLNTTFDNKIGSMKTQRGKDQWSDKKNSMLDFINNNIEFFVDVFKTQSMMVELKETLINKLQQLKFKFNSFINRSNEYSKSGQEGFVVSDIDGNVCKLVSRLEFSKNNFDNSVIKGWER